jgi:hypothetical protein
MTARRRTILGDIGLQLDVGGVASLAERTGISTSEGNHA